MRYFFFLFLSWPGMMYLSAQPLQAVKPYYVGHSLINLNVPAMVHSLALDAGKTSDYDYQIGNGANLWWQWDTLQGNEQGLPWQDALPTGQYNAMVITEAVPLLGQLLWSKTYDYADSFLLAARMYRPDIRFFIYETWHCTTTGTPAGCPWDNDDQLLWRPRLSADFPLWTGIMDTLKQRHPAAAVWMIPAGQAFGMLADSIAAGQVPGINDFRQLFTDDIHLTDVGNYFVACVMYACLFRESPEGRTRQTFSEWGVPYTPPAPDLALQMQRIAQKTVTLLNTRTGVNSPSSATNPGSLSADFQLLPNPVQAGHETRILSMQPISAIELTDAQGRVLSIQGAGGDIAAPAFTPPTAGVFFVKIRWENGQTSIRKLLVR